MGTLNEDLTAIKCIEDTLNCNKVIGARPHIDEQIAVASCSTDKGTDDFVATLVVFVGDAVAPGAVHCHAGLEGEPTDAVLTRVARRVLARHILLKNLNVLAREGHLMVIVANQACGLQTVDKGILLVKLPVKRYRVGIVFPLAVKPDGSNGSIVGQQLGQLVIHELVVLGPVGGCRIVGQVFLVATQRIVQAMPVEMGIVEMQLDAVTLAGVGEFLEDIALEGCGQ